MGPLRAILLAFLLSLAAATALSACGSESADLLPGETASEINANLDLVEQLVEEGDCVGAANAAASVGAQVEALTGVDKELKEALSEGATRLNEVIVECDEAPEEETTSSLEPEEDEQLEEDEKAQEKAEKKEQKEAEKEEKKEGKEEKEAPPVEPPGQEKEEETEAPTESSDGGTSSGGVSPSAPAGAK